MTDVGTALRRMAAAFGVLVDFVGDLERALVKRLAECEAAGSRPREIIEELDAVSGVDGESALERGRPDGDGMGDL